MGKLIHLDQARPAIAPEDDTPFGVDEPTVPCLGDSMPIAHAPLEASEESPAMTRDQRRSSRRREVRGCTVPRFMGQGTPIGSARLRELRQAEPLSADERAELERLRPRTRGDCQHVTRPCPFVGCIYSLYLDVDRGNGQIKLFFPDLEPDQMPPGASCALDVADRGGATLEELRVLSNVTRERIRQIEAKAIRKVRSHQKWGAAKKMLDLYAGGMPLGPCRAPNELAGPVEQLEEEPFEAPYGSRKEAPNPFPSVIDAHGRVRRDAVSNEPAPIPTPEPDAAVEPSNEVEEQEEPAEPAEENTMPTCTHSGCSTEVRRGKSGLMLPGADASKCIDHRCEALGLSRFQYFKKLEQIKLGGAEAPAKGSTVKAEKPRGKPGPKPKTDRTPRPARRAPKASMVETAAVGFSTPVDGKVTLTDIAKAVRLVESIGGLEIAQALAARVTL